MVTLGVLILLVALVSSNREFIDVFKTLAEQKKKTFLWIYMCGLFTALVGLFGFCVVQYQRVLQYSMFFGALLMPLWLIQGVMGLSIYALAYLRDETLDSWCPSNLNPSRFVFYD